jgi:serine O-acetyltransferase
MADGILAVLRSDVAAARDRDPAARSNIEVLLTYPGVHAVWGHRFAHALWRRNHRLLARAVSQAVRFLTSVEIHPGATIGRGLFIDHAAGVVIGETAVVGQDVTMYHGVTLGGTSLTRTKRHPTVGDRVVIGTGAAILGPVEIGHDSRIGANAVVVKNVPPNSVVVGVPGQVIARTQPRPADAPPDLDVGLLPDMLGSHLQSLMERVDRLEDAAAGASGSSQTVANGVNGSTGLNGATGSNGSNGDAARRPAFVEAGVWCGEDFSI